MGSVKAFLDTSVLIAASDAEHPFHERSRALLAAATPETTSCGAHTLAEAYAVLTRLPGGQRQRPEFAWLLIEQMMGRMTVVPLTVAEYAEALGGAAQKKLSGGIVFDALLLACARKIGAEKIYTWNVRHFQSVAPDLAVHIETP